MTMTARFDDWEGQYLAHFRTKGSKNGVRRYQTESGEWTPLGLRERAKREGWGSEERKARRAENRAARAEKRAAASAARKERMAAYKEERRKNNPKTMTDEELRKKIERVKLEMEYKELTKSPVLKAGEKLVTGYLNFKAKQEERQQAQEQRFMEREKLKLEKQRIKADVEKAKQNTERAKADASKASHEAEKMKADVQGGLKIQRKTELKRAKIDWKGTTLHGGLIRRVNALLTSGVSEKQKAIRTAQGKAESERILSDSKFKLGVRQREQKRSDSKNEANRYAAEKARYEREDAQRRKKNRRDYERSLRRMGIG